MPLAGGVLNIVSGALGIISSIVLIIIMPIFSNIFSNLVFDSSDFDGFDSDAFIVAFTVSFIVSSLLTLIPSIIAIVGGVFAIKRKRWGWALAGSICAVLCSSVMGVVAIVFIAMSKSEFTKINPQPEPPGAR